MKTLLLLVPASVILLGGAPAVRSVTLTVPINVPWTDTGIDVKDGDTICIEAKGDVIFADPDSEHHAGPDGRAATGGGCTYLVTRDGVPGQSLVGNVFENGSGSSLDGSGFFVGSRFSGAVPPGAQARKGRLFLGFNDGAVRCERDGVDAWGFGGDNHGAFEVTVTLNCKTSKKRQPVRPAS